MFNIKEFLRVVFFSGCMCCGLSTLRNIKLSVLKIVFPAGMIAAAIFYIINLWKLPFLASFVSTFAVCAFVKGFSTITHHTYFTIIIPSIYCITPGRPLVRMFFAMLNKDWILMREQARYSFIVAFGCFIAIIFTTYILNLICKNKIEYLQQYET